MPMAQKDKVDSTEWNKTMAIGRIQGNVNPFVIDATLAERCYCSGVISELTKSYIMELYPNPTKGLILYINSRVFWTRYYVHQN
jgi:hypothetical protein